MWCPQRLKSRDKWDLGGSALSDFRNDWFWLQIVIVRERVVDSFESVYFEINVIETTHLLKPPKKFPGKKCLEQKPIKEEIVGILEWKNKTTEAVKALWRRTYDL